MFRGRPKLTFSLDREFLGKNISVGVAICARPATKPLPYHSGTRQEESAIIVSYLVHLICDYGPGDMAWAEVVGSFRQCMPETTQMHLTSVKPFDTIATGFILAQLSLSEENLRPKNLLVFANTAPRKDNLKARQNNEAKAFYF